VLSDFVLRVEKTVKKASKAKKNYQN
jgi:hypothetical protein